MRRFSRPLLLISIGTFLLALAVWLDASPWLRGGYGWRWSHSPVSLAAAVPFMLALAAYTTGAWVLLRREVRPSALLGWSMLGVVVLTLATVGLRSGNVLAELFERTASALTTGPHHATTALEWNRDTLREWPATMEHLESIGNRHVALSPPGLPLLYRGVIVALDGVPTLADPLYETLLPYQCHNFNLLDDSPAEWAAAWFGIMMPLWAALAVIPLYGVAAQLVNRRSARRVVLWWPLVPGLLMFTPNWNTVYPLLSLTAFALLFYGVSSRDRSTSHTGAIIAAGGVSGLLIFANLSLVPLVGLLGCFTLLHYLLIERRAPQPPHWTRPVITGAWFGVGLAFPWVLYSVLTGGNPLAIVEQAMSSHLDLDRPYAPWLVLHPWEWFLFSGVPLVALWLAGSVRPRGGVRDAGSVLGVALLLTLIVLDLSGTARGETGRVWLFFTPFVLIAAAHGLQQLSGADARGAPWRRTWLVITLAQAALLLALASSWHVIDSGLTAPPAPPGSLATSRVVSGGVFGDHLRLAGWDARVDTATNGERAIVLQLDWHSIERPHTAYFFSALLIAPDGTPQPDATVWQPLETRYPTTCWAPGETVGDQVRLPLPPDAAAGDWWISLSVLQRTIDDYRPVARTDEPNSAQIGLGPVAVP